MVNWGTAILGYLHMPSAILTWHVTSQLIQHTLRGSFQRLRTWNGQITARHCSFSMPPAEEQKPSSHQTWHVENPPFMDILVPLKHLFSASVSLVDLPCLMTRPSPQGWRGMSGVYTGLYTLNFLPWKMMIMINWYGVLVSIVPNQCGQKGGSILKIPNLSEESQV